MGFYVILHEADSASCEIKSIHSLTGKRYPFGQYICISRPRGASDLEGLLSTDRTSSAFLLTPQGFTFEKGFKGNHDIALDWDSMARRFFAPVVDCMRLP